jgi:hypothetical protein
MHQHRVRCLLMGGQACVLYGAAEFSRDTDLAILASEANLVRLREALAELKAEVIAVPPFDIRHLEEGHAVHFRCQHPDAVGMRVDIMTCMRGVDPFPALWERRTTLEMADGTSLDLLSLPDLVLAKKTQRDKDWPMIRRLVEANYFENRESPTPAQIEFWFQELRTPELLLDLAKDHPSRAQHAAKKRVALNSLLENDAAVLARALAQEEDHERSLDRDYWLPLKEELEKLRRQR